IYLRRFLPESPRWLATHGHPEKAEAIIEQIEARVRAEGHHLPPVPHSAEHVRARKSTLMSEVFRALFKTYPQRTFFCLTLMAAQAFFYNAIFFTYAMMLTDFYDVPSAEVGYYILPFAVGNVLGSLILGRLFDTWGRK